MSTRTEDSPDRLRAHLLEALTRLPPQRRLLIAYSGGLDSTVLLNLLAAIRAEVPADLLAVHVNHGLHAAAGDWAAHCGAVCEGLGIEFLARPVDARPRGREGPEAAARHARYAAFAGLMGRGDCLLTAHHRDDQAETVLLQLLRGCGPHGLAGMPAVSGFAGGLHARPLLDVERRTLRVVAELARLDWIRDPSNSDTRLRRNYLRHDIIPGLRAHWPSVTRTLSRSAGHCADAAAILDEIGAADLVAARGPRPDMLPVHVLQEIPRARADNLLRHWIHGLGLPLPTAAQLARLREDVIGARPDAEPLLAWRGAEVRRYRGWLYAMSPLGQTDPDAVLLWDDLRLPLELPGAGRLIARRRRGKGLLLATGRQPVRVRFRRGGERLRPAGGRGARAVKKLLQEVAIPPWLRGRVPLLYVGDELAAVAGVRVDERFATGVEDEGWAVEWVRPSGVSPAYAAGRA